MKNRDNKEEDDWLSERSVKLTLEKYGVGDIDDNPFSIHNDKNEEEECKDAKDGGARFNIRTKIPRNKSDDDDDEEIVVNLDDEDGFHTKLSNGRSSESRHVSATLSYPSSSDGTRFGSCVQSCLYNPCYIVHRTYSRWVSLAAAILMNSFAGTGYAISLFTDMFRSTLLIDQESVDWISTWGNVGLYSAVIGGLLYNRCGPRITALGGAIFIGVGFLGLYSCTSTSSPEDIACRQSTLCFLNFVAQHGSGWIACATVSTSLRNFPIDDRGVAVGLTKGAFALSSSFLAELYVGMFDSDALNFLYFISVVAPVFIFVCVPFLNLVPESKGSELPVSGARDWMPWMSLVLVAAFWLVVTSTTQRSHSDSKSLRFVSLFGTYVLFGLFAFLPLLCAPRSSSSQYSRASGTDEDGEGSARRGAASSVEMVSVSNGHTQQRHHAAYKNGGMYQNVTSNDIDEDGRRMSVTRGDGAKEDKGVCGVVRSRDFYALLVTFFVGAGSALMLVNNLTQIVQSLSGKGSLTYMDTKTTLVTIFGASNLFGRVILGTVSDRVGGARHRPGFLLLSLATLGIAMFILAFADVSTLFPVTILVGIAFGGLFSICAATIGDLFGPTYFAGNYAALDLAPALGSVIFATAIAGKVYDANADAETGVCFGVDCFRSAFIASSVACFVVGVPSAWWLWRRVRGMPAVV